MLSYKGNNANQVLSSLYFLLYKLCKFKCLNLEITVLKINAQTFDM